jgi:hypothetical protein
MIERLLCLRIMLLQVNKYSGVNTCETGSSLSSLEQIAYLADGKCYSWEPNYYFKASCSGDGRSALNICSDAQCNNCNQTAYDGTCQTQANGLPTKGFCVKDNEKPSTSSNGTTSGGTSQSTATGTAKKNNGSGAPTSILSVLTAGIFALFV